LKSPAASTCGGHGFRARPRKGVIGDYRTLFDAATLRLIEERAGPVMAELGYGTR
jgi:hypothetical protein